MKRFMIDVKDEEFMSRRVEDVFLSGRTTNAVMRFGCKTVGDLVNKINYAKDLMEIRACGKSVVKSIMQELFDAYLEHLESKGKLADYMVKLMELQNMTIDRKENESVYLNQKMEVIAE